MKCENCSHAEMCKWLDELEGRGCDFFDGEQEPTIYPPCEDCRKKMDEIRRAYDHLSEQEPCDDAISREWLMRKATERFYTTNYFNHITAMIEEAPSVTQKSVKWIDYRDDGFVECPICGHATNCEDDIDELHYCFYCGARMIEPQESSEDELKDLSKRVETLEKQTKEDKEEQLKKLKAELDYAKFRCTL